MANATIFDLVQETALTASDRFAMQQTSAATRMTSATFALMGGLVNDTAAPTTSNVTGVVGTLHLLDLSGLTASRNFILPDTAQVGERIGVFVSGAHASFTLSIVTQTNGSLINTANAGGGTAWGAVSSVGELVIARCVNAGGVGDTDWVIESDNSTLAFTSEETGGTQRTIASKLADVVSDADFGAVGDGVEDDTAELTSAAATGKQVLLTGTSYNLSSDVSGAFFSLNTTAPTFTGPGVVPLGLSFPNSDLNYAQNGATIHRLADRVLAGAAVDSDMSLPNVVKDWMATLQSGSYERKSLVGAQFSASVTNGSPTVTFTEGNDTPVAGRYITGVGIPDGTTISTVDSTTQITLDTNATITLTGVTLTSAANTFLAGSPLFYTFVGLNNESPGSAGGGLFGIQTKDFTSAGTSGIGVFGFAVNNHATLAPSIWGGYFEAHVDRASGTAIGIEIDVKTQHSAAKALPNTASSVIGLQIGAGAGLSPEGQFDAGSAIAIVPNPMRFKTGLRFAADALTNTDGTGGSAATAIALAPYHALQWYNSAGAEVGKLMTTSQLTTERLELRLASPGMQVLGDSGQVLALVQQISSAVNYPTLTASASDVATFGVAGTSTDVDVRLQPKGAGYVQFGTHTGSVLSISGYITIKDAAGNPRNLAVVS